MLTNVVKCSEIETFPITLGEDIEIKRLISILQQYEEEGFNFLEVNLEYYKDHFYLTGVKTEAVKLTQEELDVIYEKNAYLRWVNAKEIYEKYQTKYEGDAKESC